MNKTPVGGRGLGSVPLTRRRGVSELDVLEEQFAALATAANRAEWPDPSVDAEYGVLEMGRSVENLDAFRADLDIRHRIEALQEIGSQLHTVDRRRLQLLRLNLDEPIEGALANRLNSIEREILSSGPSPIGAAIAEDSRELIRRSHLIRELAAARNDFARALGHSNYLVLLWRRAEMGARGPGAVLASAEQETRREYFMRKRILDQQLARRPGSDPLALRREDYKGTRPRSELQPKTERDRRVADATSAFERLGFPNLHQASLYWGEAQANIHQTGAYTKSIDRLGDVRIWMSGTAGSSQDRVLAHEFAHAAYDLASLEAPSYLLRVAPHPCLSEGLAQMIEWCSRSWEWKEAFPAQTPRASISDCMRVRDLSSTRQLLVRATIERELYRRPDADLDACGVMATERFRGILDDHAPKGQWASATLASKPLNAFSYLIGRRICGQLFHVLRNASGGWKDFTKVGASLLPLMRQGAIQPWEEALACWIRKALPTCTN